MGDAGLELYIQDNLLRLSDDYFTENFQVKENKTKMSSIHPRIFQFFF